MTIYVTMTDKFMSVWGPAKDKTNKYVVECENYEQAIAIQKAGEDRAEMRHVNIRSTKPYYNTRTHIASYVHFDELGDIWKKYMTPEHKKVGRSK